MVARETVDMRDRIRTFFKVKEIRDLVSHSVPRTGKKRISMNKDPKPSNMLTQKLSHALKQLIMC